MNFNCCYSAGSVLIATKCDIERQLELDRVKHRSTAKLLLLGTGESGKSTLLKQIRIIHIGGFTDSDREFQRLVIINHVIQSTRLILEGMKLEGVPFAEENLRTFCESFLRDTEIMTPFLHLSLPDFGAVLRSTWNDAKFRAALADPKYASLVNDNTIYFIDNQERICSPDYVPTDQDILCARIETCGVIELEIKLQSMNLCIVDVGGQRSQRRKWLRCFEDVQGVIFVVAISEYFQVLREDGKTNRMKESLSLFANTSNSIVFKNTNILLFLNKIDIFKEMIKQLPITLAFPEYKGNSSFESSSEFIKQAFLSKCVNRNRTIYEYFTCATDTKHVETILDVAFDIVIQSALKITGIMSA